MRHTYCILCVLCVMVTSANAQNISRIEYFINTDPGFGKATVITGYTASADVADFPVSVNLSSVSNGLNFLYIRAKDGNGSWSITNSTPFIKVDIIPSDIVRAEYFLNTDPGFGKATAITGFTTSPDVAGYPVSINLNSISDGLNFLFIRAEDRHGNWSISSVTPFIKVDVIAPDIVKAEYFLNTDPGFGLAMPVVLPVSANISAQAITISIEAAPIGINTLFLRAKDSKGIWSLTNSHSFIKGIVEGDISSLEYFIDNDPGFGMGIPVELIPAQNVSNYILDADVSSVADNTTHNLFIRAKDTDGAWSLTNILSFTKMPGVGIDELTDASSVFLAFPNPAADKITIRCLTDIKMDKIELMDVNGKSVPVNSSGSSTKKQIDISMLSEGIYFIRITSGKEVLYKKMVKE